MFHLPHRRFHTGFDANGPSVLNLSGSPVQIDDFYDSLLGPVSAELGGFDPECLTAIVGFDAGGPVSLLTIGRRTSSEYVSYVTCELAVREDQVPSDLGRYELLVTCDDEAWARTILTNVGRMSTEVQFGDGHTLDIGPWVDEEESLQGLAFERFCESVIGERPYLIFRLHGLTLAELNSAFEAGVDAVLAKRKSTGIYLVTRVRSRDR